MQLDSQVEAVAWAILQALHEDVPEDKRPMSWSDLKDGQESRIRAAATAAIETAGLQLGATGTFPHGKLNEQDEGAIKMAIGYDQSKGVVMVNFGKPVAWFGLPPPEARELARLLLLHAQSK